MSRKCREATEWQIDSFIKNKTVQTIENIRGHQNLIFAYLEKVYANRGRQTNSLRFEIIKIHFLLICQITFP